LLRAGDELCEVGADASFLEIAPDALVLAAVIRSAGHRPVLVNRAAKAFAVEVAAVAVFVAGDEIRMSKSD
jgi:hypothetical protein